MQQKMHFYIIYSIYQQLRVRHTSYHHHSDTVDNKDVTGTFFSLIKQSLVSFGQKKGKDHTRVQSTWGKSRFSFPHNPKKTSNSGETLTVLYDGMTFYLMIL